MASTIWNQNLNAGEYWTAELVLATSAGVARNLTGCTFTSQIRKHHKSVSAKETIAVSTKNTLAGEMVVSLTNTQTTNLKDGRYVYDIEMINAPTLVVSNASGAMTTGETITGTSGATGIIVAHSPLTSISYYVVSGIFIAGDVITGGASGETTTVVSLTTGIKERIIEGTIVIRPEVTR